MVSADRPLTLADLDQIPVTRLKGVGEKKAAGLATAEITTVLDLLTHYPRRYIDRTREATLAELTEGELGAEMGAGHAGEGQWQGPEPIDFAPEPKNQQGHQAGAQAHKALEDVGGLQRDAAGEHQHQQRHHP